MILRWHRPSSRRFVRHKADVPFTDKYRICKKIPTNLMICRDFNYLCVYAVLLFSVVSVRICYQRNRLTSKVGLFEYQVLNGKLIVPTGCENSFFQKYQHTFTLLRIAIITYGTRLRQHSTLL